MSLFPPKPLKSGDPLTLGYMNKQRDVAGSGRLRVDPSTGLRLVVTAWGSFLQSIAPPEGWYLVTASHGGGEYTLVEQIESALGGWSTGPRTITTAYESNLNTSVPSGSTVRVWARRRRLSWRFTWGACSS